MLNIKEIIWEITSRCDNECDYCGSCDVIHKTNPTEKDILTIASKIAEYPPEEINISGGDPTLISFDIHKKIVKLFKEANIIPKILVNPISIVKNNLNTVNSIIGLYDAVGFSINTEDEFTIFSEHKHKLDMNKITFISNFNKSNLWMFDRLYKMAAETNRLWQIQLTMFHENNTLAIYDSQIAIEEFFTKLAKARGNYSKIIFGDNITCNECTAGINTLGILATGEVIPCLSMRAWTDNVYASSQGNLLSKESTLKDIWENNFKDQRFYKFRSCIHHCKSVGCRKEVQDILSSTKSIPNDHKIVIPDLTKPNIPVWPDPKKYPGDPNIVMVYGVQMDHRGPWNISVNGGIDPEILENLPSWTELQNKYKNNKDNDKKD